MLRVPNHSSGNGSIVKVSGNALASNVLLEQMFEERGGCVRIVEGGDMEAGCALDQHAPGEASHLRDDVLVAEPREGGEQLIRDPDAAVLTDPSKPLDRSDGEVTREDRRRYASESRRMRMLPVAVDGAREDDLPYEELRTSPGLANHVQKLLIGLLVLGVAEGVAGRAHREGEVTFTECVERLVRVPESFGMWGEGRAACGIAAENEDVTDPSLGERVGEAEELSSSPARAGEVGDDGQAVGALHLDGRVGGGGVTDLARVGHGEEIRPVSPAASYGRQDSAPVALTRRTEFEAEDGTKASATSADIGQARALRIHFEPIPFLVDRHNAKPYPGKDRVLGLWLSFLTMRTKVAPY